MDKLLLHARGVWELLGECRTVFYGPTGSFHDPEFPAPVRRPGRAPQWLRHDVEIFATQVAERYRDDGRRAPALPDPVPGAPRRRRGRPRMPRPFEATRG